MIFHVHGQLTTIQKLGGYFYQVEDKTIVNNPQDFSYGRPFHLQLNTQGKESFYLQLAQKNGCAIFVNGKLYHRSDHEHLYLIPIKNLQIFSGTTHLTLSVFGNIPTKLLTTAAVVAYSSTINPDRRNLYLDSSAEEIPTKYHSIHYFNQIGFLFIILFSVAFGQTLFAKRTVFIGANAIRQSRFRSIDDNVKLFGFNSLVFGFLFTGFAISKSAAGADGLIITTFMKIVALVAVFFGLKILLNSVSKKIFFDSNALSFYANNYLHITAVFGLFIASIFYFEAFSFYPVPYIPIVAYIILFMVAEVAYVLSFAFSNYELSRYKLFYIISYICAFEGIPLMFLAKYLFQTGIISS
ncbi:MAG: DUF4271 domain-containing protein [Cytophagales bacterium]|nr:DUF4271 domain-containing protein [Cytophagales bacterium]